MDALMRGAEAEAPLPGNRYQLVAIDLDGTLVDDQNAISERVERTVREVRSSGIKVVLVSGRPQVAALPIFRQLGLALPLISSGGAQVSDPSSGRVIAHFQPPVADIRKLVTLARAAGLTLVYQTPDEVFGEGNAQILDILRAAVRIPIEQVEDGLAACPEPIKVTVCGPRSQLDRIRDEIERLGLALSSVLSGPEYLEVTAQGVSKGRALRSVAEFLDVPMDRVLVIGDAPNDISMLAEAGLAVAMGNAPPEVQAFANVVAPRIEDDGVAWALRRFVLAPTKRGAQARSNDRNA
ncbi:MAG: HAD family phosphatase [Chloroflexi bacterium]|nr:MAG: HAD family phosphatase [Chloroflexota bacterium]